MSRKDLLRVSQQPDVNVAQLQANLRDALEVLSADDDVLRAPALALTATGGVPPGTSVVVFNGRTAQSIGLPAANSQGAGVSALVLILNVSTSAVTVYPSRADKDQGRGFAVRGRRRAGASGERRRLALAGVAVMGRGLPTRNIPVFVGQGIDTKINPALMPSGELLEVENMYYQQTGKLQLRNGFAKQAVGSTNGTIVVGREPVRDAAGRADDDFTGGAGHLLRLADPAEVQPGDRAATGLATAHDRLRQEQARVTPPIRSSLLATSPASPALQQTAGAAVLYQDRPGIRPRPGLSTVGQGRDLSVAPTRQATNTGKVPFADAMDVGESQPSPSGQLSDQWRQRNHRPAGATPKVLRVHGSSGVAMGGLLSTQRPPTSGPSPTDRGSSIPPWW